MTKKIMNFFDGINKQDVTSAISRYLVLVFAIITSLYFLGEFQSDKTQLDLTMNPYYSIIQDSTATQDVKNFAISKLTKLEGARQATSFWQTIFHTSVMMFFFVIVAGLCAFGFTKWNWSGDRRLDDNNLKEYADVQKEKMSVLKVIFATVFVAGSIIYLADKL